MNTRTPRKTIAIALILSLLLAVMPSAAQTVNAVEESAAQPAESLDPGTRVMTAAQISAECQILDYVHEDVFNEGNHIARLPEEESLDTYAFLNEDGTKTVYYLDQAVKYRDANGTVREKNIDLTASLTGYSTAQNDVRLHIPTNAASGIQLSYDGYDVSIMPQGGRVNPVAQRGDKSVGYPNFYGSGTALVYTPTLSGVKEDIVLAQYTGVSEFTFLLNTDGLNLYHTPEDRYYLALTEEAQMKIWLGNIEIFDAAAKPSMGTLTVETVTAGEQYRLTISADVAFLTDPDTVYPVTIDPTITVWDNTHGVNAIEDAPIFEGYPTSNFGTYQYDRAGYVDASYKRGRTVVRLNGLLTNSAYKSASEYNISSVIFYIADATGTAASTVNLYPQTSNYSWTETNVTWANFGIYTLSERVSANVGYEEYASFNITALARMWKNGTYNGNCGFILVGASESSVDRSLYSCENSTSSMRPYVVATYNENLASGYYPAPYSNEINIVDSGDQVLTVIYDDALQLRANCYGYALRVFYNGNIEDAGTSDNTAGWKYLTRDGTYADPCCYKQRPGEFAVKPLTRSNGKYSWEFKTNEDLNDYEAGLIKEGATDDDLADIMAQLIVADLAAFGCTGEVLAQNAAIPSASTLESQGKRLIALAYKETTFHFYMQHSDNSWSHKNGIDAPTNWCINGCCQMTSNALFAAHALEDELSGGQIRYIIMDKSPAVDCSHYSIGSNNTTLCTSYNAKAVGDNLSSATELGTTLPASFSGYIDCKDDVDFFELSPGTSKTASFSFTSSDTKLIVTLYNASGAILYGPTSASSTVSFTRYLTAGTVYYLSVKGEWISAHSIRDYSLSIS